MAQLEYGDYYKFVVKESPYAILRADHSMAVRQLLYQGPSGI